MVAYKWIKERIGGLAFYAQTPNSPKVQVKILALGKLQAYVEVLEDKGGFKRGGKMHVDPGNLYTS